MAWLSYIPGKSTLLLLFKAARVRLMANSENVGALANARIASATEEINQISDDIRDAKAAAASNPVNGGALSAPADAAPATSEATATGKDSPPILTKATDKPAKNRVPTVAAINSPRDDAGVQWAGEYDALAGRREKGAFASQLALLGYSAQEFRVTVRRIPPDGPADTRQRYTVLVMQLRDGMPIREKRYDGGHGSEWVNEFSRDAAVAFPRKVEPNSPPIAPDSSRTGV
jgi:hypothetical protein